MTFSLSPSSPSSSLNKEEVSIQDLWDQTKTLVATAWSLTPRRVRLAGGYLIFCITIFGVVLPRINFTYYPAIPTLHLDYHESASSHYNASKVALLVENRPNPILAPLMLHFMSVVPPDWRFRFMGSTESVGLVNKSIAIREQVANGKLDLTYIPSNMSTMGQEMISRFFTTLWLYEVVLQPAEWLLVFQTDSILCANSRHNINEYLEYDWIGAPWNPNGRYGGNGGLSLRRVSAIIDVLRDQVRVDGSEPEDLWLAERLAHRYGARMANGTTSLTFSGEVHTGEATTVGHYTKWNPTSEEDYVEGIDDWRQGHYEPMGYHTGGSGSVVFGGIWGTPDKRKHIWDYCPEVKMTLSMDAAKFVPGNCNSNWKRDADWWENTGPMGETGAIGLSGDGFGYGTEMIDGVEYPMLPPNLMPW